MSGFRLGILATLTYFAIIAVATFYFFQLREAPSDIRGVLRLLFPVQLVAVIVCLAVIARSIGWRAAGFGKISWSGMIWFLPGWAVLGLMALGITEAAAADNLRDWNATGLALLVLTTLLIAIGEEVTFRGILLRGALTRLSVPSAMLFSTVAFGLFHFVNGLAGQNAADTSQQVIFAVLAGFFLAPIALRVGNLWPLIIWHWLWNMGLILGQSAGVFHPFVLIGIAIQAVVSIWLWAALIRTLRLH